ncbi:MAG: NAD(P)H-dependent oxidoreductase [Flavobacteriales bacterium]|nr:NAD(P)H-dependent oxidoreductase [Flavobacteriales bacterium]MBQ2421853.1 NAD(P)H-dependent oxidoreductase [Flavobacteriales bacterium]MBQ5815000.1 NAD(P)H-dependent oxidoreductase [Flavobacteriales bacterium]
MKKLMVIDCCMREGSRTERILNPVVEALSSRYEVERIKVEDLHLTAVDSRVLEERASGYVPEEIVALSRRLASASRIVIAAPFWDMSFPAALKVFFENMSLFNITFADDGEKCVGLCSCERVLYITTRGMNIHTGDDIEQGTPYIKALSRLWGLGDVITVAAENMDYSTDVQVEEKIKRAIDEALTICKDF